MRKKNQTKLAPIKKGVVVEPHRGVVYFDDSACRVKKFHDRGCRNVYSVVLTYYVPALARKKVIRLDYGQFHQAHGRYFIETSRDYAPSKMEIKEIRLLVSTFQGTKLLNEDVLRCVEYGKRKLRGLDENYLLGEELY